MIKVDKDLNDIPPSLNSRPETLAGNERTKARTTHSRRLELISAKKYIDHKNYNSRYKVKDIKDALDIIYNKKCAYCESGIEDRHVEHYRPKSTYYWLAYSWDNLLIACSTCNSKKLAKFDILATKVKFRRGSKIILNINSLSERYNAAEQPKLVNPEIFDPSPYLVFDILGKISSTHTNVDYTIETCKLNRTELKDKRKKLINDFREALEAEITLLKNPDDQYNAAKVLFRDFVRKSRNKEEEFLAFRKFHICNNSLELIINQLLPV